MSNAKRNPKKTKGLGAGIVAFGAVFALYSWFFHPHSIGGYILALALSGLFGAIVRVMGQGLDLTVKEKEPESLRNMSADTGNPDVDALLSRGREMITQIREENKQIPDAALAAKLDQLEHLCSEVFRAVYDKPAKAPQIRKFMDYYLPTTLKMVKGYRVLGERNRAGEDTAAARRRIDEALGVVLKGCQKMLDKLYRDDVLDITTDIDVLEQMLKRDGLAESDLERAAAQARQAAQIDREVDRAAREKATRTGGAASVPMMRVAQPAPQAAQPYDPNQWHTGQGTDVAQQVRAVAQQAAEHTPQVPVIGGEAMAQAPQKQE